MDLSTFRRDLVNEARSNLGYNGSYRNFFEILGVKKGQNWCSIFGAYCIRRAFAKQGYSAPDWIWRRTWVPEPGAKRLLKNIASVKADTYQGRWLKPEEVCPGDFVVWNRTKIPGDWRGHFGIVVERGRFAGSGFSHVSGNAGHPPKVRERITGEFSDPMLWRFAGLR